MRITTWNVNGLRAALRKDFAAHVEALAPDVLLLQEVRSTPDQLPPEWQAPEGWNVAWNPAQKAGYAGTAVWSRHPVEVVGTGLDGDDPEGRLLQVRTGGVRVISLYLPSGTSGPDKQANKEAYMAAFAPWARALVDADEPVLIGGDYNIAHTERDI
ncbi:MAG TPA: exodeoxyribonuclease III, partial [Myxococcota bacterium]|nr:exodeoxyribonuclease III [Myxococcota bacterium]